MGCCFSSVERDPHAQNPSRPDLSPPHPPAMPCNKPGVTWAAATTLEEEEEEVEEAVKEVLSETPLPKPRPPIQTTTDDNVKLKAEARFLPKFRECALEARTPIGKKEVDVAEVISECSELCSVGESFSTASATTGTTATTIAEKKETEVTSRDRGEVTQRVIKRSPMKVQRNRPYSGEQMARRATRSPAKKPELSKTTATQQRSRMGTTTAALRREQSDGLGRRSRSPATRNGGGGRRSGVGGSPAKKTGNAGGRSAATPAGDVDKQDVDMGGKGGNDGDSKQGSEIVDNPLVSLECFIFL